MRHGSPWVLAAATALALAGPSTAQDPQAEARKDFEALQGMCKGGDAAVLGKVLHDALGEKLVGKDPEAVARWRTEFAGAIRSVAVAEVRGSGPGFVIRGAAGGSEFEFLRSNEGGAWGFLSPVAYLVKGKALDAANGRGPAKVRLMARRTNDDYGASAVSFAHVTQDPKQCLSRLDLWYCHNGDLHASGESRICRVAGKALADVKGIPSSAKWSDTMAPETGGVYVIHCLRRMHRDFHVRVRAASVKEAAVDLEWSILAAGFGSPASIQKPQPPVQRKAPDGSSMREGADGTDGLCGRNGNDARSVPEPEPAPEGTSTPPGGK